MENLGIVQFWTFLSGVIVIILLPGPNSLFVLKTSISRGAQAAWQAVAAVLLGDALLILLAYLGVASLLLASPELFRWVRYLGAAYLLYLGVQILLSLRQHQASTAAKSPQTRPQGTAEGTAEGSLEDSAEGISENSAEVRSTKKTGSVFRKSLILSLTNPKAILFYLSFFIQFIDYSYQPAWLPYLVLAMVLELVSLCYLAVLIYAGRAIAGFFGHQPKVAMVGNLLLGLLFSAFAIRLVWA